MNPTRDLERRIADYYAAEAPTRAPDWVLTHALDTIDTTRQRRSWLGRSWKVAPRTSTAKLAVGSVAVVTVALVGLTFLQGSVSGPATTPSPPPVVSAAPATSDTMWPQSSLAEVQQAQALADAGDPAYTWQVDPRLSSIDGWWGHLRQPGTEIVERFLREKLGWDAFLFNPFVGDDGDGAADGIIRGVTYLRCGPGETNPLYPVAPGEPHETPGAERCAPTIDELTYESVSLDLSQPGEDDPNGIWVVSRWRATAPFAQVDPAIAEAEANTRLDAFLQARVEGSGAEGRVEVSGPYVVHEVPLLYSTSSGSPYERYEIERVGEPRWPDGSMDFKVRLFADGGETVVEQQIGWAGTLGHDERTTTENGRPVAVPYTVFDGGVTVSAASPWRVSVETEVVFVRDDIGVDRIEVMDDPLPVGPGCEPGPTPADAAALAQALQSDRDLKVTAPLSVSVGGADGLVMDITAAAEASACDLGPWPVLTDGGRGWTGLDEGRRMRLYLIDVPDGLATRILAIAVVAPQSRFDKTLAAATPVLDSIEFHAP